MCKRKRLRLANFVCSKPGAHLVAICVQNRFKNRNIFGEKLVITVIKSIQLNVHKCGKLNCASSDQFGMVMSLMSKIN
jgi:hypothetical protein